MNLTLLAEHCAIAKLPPKDSVPPWATQGQFFSITRTREELSIVVHEKHLPPTVSANTGWRVLQVQGPVEFSQVGVLRSLTSPLAEAGISVFAISTYDTDYILVKEENLKRAAEALTVAGHHHISNAGGL